MLVSRYDQFVQDSDQSRDRPYEERLDIATYGLAGEVGSVVAAIKKRLLSENGQEEWCVANDEIVEELGDVVWYCFSLAKIANSKKPVNIFTHDIANLKKEIGADDARARLIKSVLDPSKRAEFLAAAEAFPKQTKFMEFEDYQSIAFLTARTKDRTLVEVCLAVLWQLSAQLFRRKLPAIELELNKALVDRPVNDVLGEIAWHIAALASIYGLKLSHIAEKNIEKVSFRLDRRHPTPLHDREYQLAEQFPPVFDISFVSVAQDRSQMYFNGKRLGNELTDNQYENDGYRYHDVMHLANAAKLGWSPVLRKLLGRKRKSNGKVDEVEDGARAQIVEEAVIKAIHSEGERLAELNGAAPGCLVQLFPSSADITFRFLKFIRNFVSKLEVAENRYWEWEEAILAGHDVFYKLRCEGQGTVTVDLNNRSLTFRPEVSIGIRGKVAGLGAAQIAPAEGDTEAARRQLAQKLAILKALQVPAPENSHLASLDLKEFADGKLSVKSSGEVQSQIWKLGVVDFRTTITMLETGAVYCTALALSDD